MSELLNAAILGIVQGLTEFLPVSSSGHLELSKFFLGYSSDAEESLLMTVVLHFATALSTIVVFRKDVWNIIKALFRSKYNESQRFTIMILISMIPAIIVGLSFESIIESLFDQKILLVAMMLIVTGILLFLADKAKQTTRKVNWIDALVIGASQAIAILPGISRSGATISTSVLLGVDREKAARFSFLMVVPLIFGKIIQDLNSGTLSLESSNIGEITVGFIASFITGIIACSWMITLVKRSKLVYFSVYCFAIALFVIIYLVFS